MSNVDFKHLRSGSRESFTHKLSVRCARLIKPVTNEDDIYRREEIYKKRDDIRQSKIFTGEGPESYIMEKPIRRQIELSWIKYKTI